MRRACRTDRHRLSRARVHAMRIGAKHLRSARGTPLRCLLGRREGHAGSDVQVPDSRCFGRPAWDRPTSMPLRGPPVAQSSAVNHDLRLLRKMFNWGIRQGLLSSTSFKIGPEPAISLEREVPRNRRSVRDEDEDRLLAACNDHLRAVVTATLDTACRPGEVLSLQWADVSLTRREIRILAVREQTRRERIIPISSRLLSLLEMRKLDPSGSRWNRRATCLATRLASGSSPSVLRGRTPASGLGSLRCNCEIFDTKRPRASTRPVCRSSTSPTCSATPT